MYSKKCIFCEKVLEGFSKEQAEYCYKQHVLAKHPKHLLIV